ncbi:uncharacterized protein EI90DRAFT_3011980 [Cantharellus anzutake]|uniref:uncharacterized protein n=1 Tax=Cantharellus anzutake TaxID=1750568 RepID=UPI00190496CE|nr:uncharacterized protein EI90DRAFT_3011980 [Cantharellus anzutake]KAF8341361.1 hypothetical protein EI90DRAFT_3011980 [Cantharellus anzutake]
MPHRRSKTMQHRGLPHSDALGDSSDSDLPFQFSYFTRNHREQHSEKTGSTNNEAISDAELGPVATAARKRQQRPTLAIATHEADVAKSKKRRLARAEKGALSGKRAKPQSVSPTAVHASYPARHQKSPTSRLRPQPGYTNGKDSMNADSPSSEQEALAEREDPDFLSNSGSQRSDEQNSAQSNNDNGPTWEQLEPSAGPSRGRIRVYSSGTHDRRRETGSTSQSKLAPYNFSSSPIQHHRDEQATTSNHDQPSPSNAASVTVHGVASLGPKGSVKKRKQRTEGEPTVKDATLDFWRRKGDDTSSVVTQSRVAFLRLVATNPWSLGKHKTNGLRNEDTSVHARFAHDALMGTAQRLGLSRDQFTVKPLMITTLIRIVSNFRNRFRTQAIQAIKDHYNLADLASTEQVEKATELLDGFNYIWHDYTTKGGPYEHPLIAEVIMVFFHYKLQHIPQRLGELYLDNFKDFNDHRELIALALSAIHCALQNIANNKTEFAASRFSSIHENHLIDLQEFSVRKSKRWARICAELFWTVAWVWTWRALEREHLYEENSGMIVAAAEKPLGNIGGWSDSD